MTTATAAPTSPAPSSPTARSVPHRAVIEPPTAAPIATNAIWPRLTSPAHPVSTTSDRAMIAYTSATAARLVRLSENTAGTRSSSTATTATVPARTTRTSVRRASAAGTGRGSRIARHVDGSVRVRRPRPAGVHHSASNTTTNNTGCTYCGWFQSHTTACSTMPRPIAANAIVGRCSIRPITAAASAGSSSDGPSTVPIDRPTIPARRNTARNASTDVDHPHRGVHVAHGDADERGALGVVGARAHRGAESRAEEQREADERERAPARPRARRCRRSGSGRR